jgi:hypothetical protein
MTRISVAYRPDMASGADGIVRVFRTVQSAAAVPRLLADAADKDTSAGRVAAFAYARIPPECAQVLGRPKKKARRQRGQSEKEAPPSTGQVEYGSPGSLQFKTLCSKLRDGLACIFWTMACIFWTAVYVFLCFWIVFGVFKGAIP